MIGTVLGFLFSSSSQMPELVWFVPFVILAILGWAALADARTGRVPNVPLAVGAIIALCASVWGEGQLPAIQRLVVALAAIAILWVINTSYFRLCRRDAFGFGDVKWSGLAVFIFGLEVLFWTWCVAAWIGVIWFVGRKVLGIILPRLKGRSYIHFVPFLFFGLIVVEYVQENFFSFFFNMGERFGLFN